MTQTFPDPILREEFECPVCHRPLGDRTQDDPIIYSDDLRGDAIVRRIFIPCLCKVPDAAVESNGIFVHHASALRKG